MFSKSCEKWICWSKLSTKSWESSMEKSFCILNTIQMNSSTFFKHIVQNTSNWCFEKSIAVCDFGWLVPGFLAKSNILRRIYAKVLTLNFHQTSSGQWFPSLKCLKNVILDSETEWKALKMRFLAIFDPFWPNWTHFDAILVNFKPEFRLIQT